MEQSSQQRRPISEIDWLALARKAQYRCSSFARLIEISPRQVERSFGKDCGQTPQCWLNEVCRWTAALLLEEGKKPKKIFADLGFSDHSAFFHAFKRYFGCAPKQYVSRHVCGSDGKASKLREFFPLDELPANWRKQSLPFNALEILVRRIRRSETLAVHVFQMQCRAESQRVAD